MRLNLFNSKDENAFSSMRSSVDMDSGISESFEFTRSRINRKSAKIQRERRTNDRSLRLKHKSSRLEEQKYNSGIFHSEQIKEEASEYRSDEGMSEHQLATSAHGNRRMNHLSASSSNSSVYKSSDGGSSYFNGGKSTLPRTTLILKAEEEEKSFAMSLRERSGQPEDLLAQVKRFEAQSKGSQREASASLIDIKDLKGAAVSITTQQSLLHDEKLLRGQDRTFMESTINLDSLQDGGSNMLYNVNRQLNRKSNGVGSYDDGYPRPTSPHNLLQISHQQMMTEPSSNIFNTSHRGTDHGTAVAAGQ